MKRDMDLIRSMLIRIEEDTNTYSSLQSNDFVIDGFTMDQVNYNLELLVEEEYIKGEIFKFSGGGMDISVESLTWKGHDFVEAARDDSRWKETKSILEKVKDFSIDLALIVLKELAVTAAKGYITR